MRRPLLGPLCALALAAGLAACGGGGTSTRATSSQQASLPAHAAARRRRAARHRSSAHAHAGRARSGKEGPHGAAHGGSGGGEGTPAGGHGESGSAGRFVADPCSKPSACTAASRHHRTFWPSRKQAVPKRDGAVTYAPIPGEVIPQAGEMALSSPAFAINEPLPKAYSCDGAGISPPLEWKNVPANAAALVLLVIDLSSDESNGGIRWIVGDIDPSSHGVAAGQIPAGGVVGTNAEGKAAYGAVCPASGKESWVEFQLYALSQKIGLAPGFEAAEAESAYAGLLLGNGAATTYSLYLGE
jgi:phosphatidylethanolamine-binding protein (PEBP) family uncharacterized protein